MDATTGNYKSGNLTMKKKEQPLKEKRTQLETFFQALYKVEDSTASALYESVFNPTAYSEFRSLNNLVTSVVEEQISETKFFNEHKEEAYKIIKMAAAATVDVISEAYRANMALRKRAGWFDELPPSTGKGGEA